MQLRLHAKISCNEYPQKAGMGAAGPQTYASESFPRVLTVYFRRAAAATPTSPDDAIVGRRGMHKLLSAFQSSSTKCTTHADCTQHSATCRQGFTPKSAKVVTFAP